jgi:mannitol/fructose-specific phosphotransferase system IIA component (Ntr-type)
MDKTISLHILQSPVTFEHNDLLEKHLIFLCSIYLYFENSSDVRTLRFIVGITNSLFIYV